MTGSQDAVSMVDYFIDFELWYDRMRRLQNRASADAVLAFKLLHTVGLTVEYKQLALTTCPSLSFVNTKSALKRIFGDNTPQKGAGELQVS